MPADAPPQLIKAIAARLHAAGSAFPIDEARMLMTEVAALGQAAHVEDAAAVGQIEMCASPTGDGRCVPLRLHAPAVQYGIALGAHALPRGSGADLCAHCAHQTV